MHRFIRSTTVAVALSAGAACVTPDITEPATGMGAVTGSGGQAGAPGAGGSAPPAGTGGHAANGGAPAGTGGSTPASTGGAPGAGGAPGTGGDSVDAGPTPETGPAPDGAASLEKFSFFYTSLAAMRRLSGSPNGFGGDFRFGMPTGLEGADKICQTIATDVGFGAKTWRAYLSVVRGKNGQPEHAIDRIGNGPWYDRRGRLIAMNRAGLVGTFNRPMGDPQAVADLADETGAGTKQLGDTHDVVTGSNRQGMLRFPGLANTCQDWTSATGSAEIGFGHSWPAGSGMHWSEVHTGHSCVPGVNLIQNGGGNGRSIGAGGGWGGIYCFALTP